MAIPPNATTIESTVKRAMKRFDGSFMVGTYQNSKNVDSRRAAVRGQEDLEAG
jgi:hypothetical protein